MLEHVRPRDLAIKDIQYFDSQCLRSIWGTKGSVTRGDTTDEKRVCPLALTGAATGLLLLVLTLLLGLALRFPPLRVGVRPIVASGAGTTGSAPVFALGARRVVRGERVGRVGLRVEAREVALDLADVRAGASLVAFEEDDFDAARGEERAVPEVD
jgi:hypothetical protein